VVHRERKTSKGDKQMATEQKVIVEIPAADRYAKKSWAKKLTRIDTSKANGFAFEGDWLQVGRKAELPIGAVVLSFSQAGSRNRPCPIAKIFRVAGDGMEEVLAVQGDDWALDLRDKAAELVNAPAAPAEQIVKPANPLAGFATEELIAELRRRGVAISE